MLLLTQFDLPFFDNFTIRGEYEGNEKSDKIIIFSHGFGVKRDSWGMFNEIGDGLKHDFLVIRFDYNKIIPEKNATYVFPLSLQSKMLDHVSQYFRNTFATSHHTIIAHSMGCVVASSVDVSQIDQTVLLAPPLTTPYMSLKSYFSKRSGTHFDEGGITTIERSDGSFTYVPSEFWDEVIKTNPLNLYQEIQSKTSVYAIHPLQDQILGNEPYAKLKHVLKDHYYEQDGNHGFAPPHRQQLLDTIKQIIGNTTPPR